MDKKQFLQQEEQRFQRVCAWKNRTYAELFCSEQFLLLEHTNGNYELVPDGMLDPGESFDEVYRLNIFGKLVQRSSYTFK